MLQDQSKRNESRVYELGAGAAGGAGRKEGGRKEGEEMLRGLTHRW